MESNGMSGNLLRGDIKTGWRFKGEKTIAVSQSFSFLNN
jgi:hypothetical protein